MMTSKASIFSSKICFSLIPVTHFFKKMDLFSKLFSLRIYSSISFDPKKNDDDFYSGAVLNNSKKIDPDFIHFMDR